jgi:hypothetical protein
MKNRSAVGKLSCVQPPTRILALCFAGVKGTAVRSLQASGLDTDSD